MCTVCILCILCVLCVCCVYLACVALSRPPGCSGRQVCMCIVACCERCTCPGVGSPANPSFARCARLVCFVLPAFEAFLLLAILDPSTW